MENQETINKLRRIYKESTNETAKAGAKAKLEQMGVSLTDEKPKGELSQDTIDKLRRIYKESTNETAKAGAKKKLEDAGVSLSGEEPKKKTEKAKSEPKSKPKVNERIAKMVEGWKEEGRSFSKINNDDDDFFKIIKKDMGQVGVTSQTGDDLLYYNTDIYENDTDAIRKNKSKAESKAKTTKSATQDNDDYCNELITKEKERKAKAKANAVKRANAPKKTPATKNKEAVSKTNTRVTKSVESRAKKGEVKVAELEKLIAEYEEAIKKLKTLLSKVKSGKKFAKGGNMGMMDSGHSREYHKIKDHHCGCGDKMEHGGGIGGNKNAKYLSSISSERKAKVLQNIAKHYGISVKEAENEVTDADAEDIYDYIANDKQLQMSVYTEFKSMNVKMAKGGMLNNGKLYLKHFVATIHEDSYEEGEGNYVNEFSENINMSFDSGKDLLEYIKSNIIYDSSAEFFVFEDGRVSCSLMVDNNNSSASKSEIERWKKGEEKLYVADYSFTITIMQEETPSQEDLSKMLGINVYAKGGTTVSSDRLYRALKSGKRKSYKYASVEMRGGGVYHRRNANQYGKVKGGNTYYEYSENRSDSQPRKYLAKGGNIGSLSDFNINDLDPYETFIYNDMSKKMSKEDALQIIINNVEGDYSQLSPKLRRIAKKQ